MAGLVRPRHANDPCRRASFRRTIEQILTRKDQSLARNTRLLGPVTVVEQMSPAVLGPRLLGLVSIKGARLHRMRWQEQGTNVQTLSNTNKVVQNIKVQVDNQRLLFGQYGRTEICSEMYYQHSSPWKDLQEAQHLPK